MRMQDRGEKKRTLRIAECPFLLIYLMSYFKACSISVVISSIFSMPIERRMRSGAMLA